MSKLKENLGSIIMCLFELAVGILLLVDPVLFTTGIIIAFGAGLVIAGIVSIVQYFRLEPAEAVKTKSFAIGLFALLAGILVLVKFQWIVDNIAVVTIIYGAAILVSGLLKAQWTADLLRMKKPKWFLPAIGALISVIFGIIVIVNPFATTDILWIFTGIYLIAEAVYDVVSMVFTAFIKPKAAISAPVVEAAE